MQKGATVLEVKDAGQIKGRDVALRKRDEMCTYQIYTGATSYL
jgi:hypothetical protein